MKLHDRYDFGNEIYWIAGAWVASLLLLLLTSCRSTDAAPDEFSVQVGTTDSEGTSTTSAGPFGGRTTANAGGDSQWLAVGWTWHLGDTADREERAATEARYLESLRALKQDPVVAPADEEQAGVAQLVEPRDAGSSPAPAPVQPFSISLLIPFLPGILLAVLAAIFGKPKVSA